MIEIWKNHVIIESILTSLAILIGGGWAFYRFILNREGSPKIEFNLDLRVLGRENGNILLEVISIIENKGRVRHRVRDFTFSLLILKKEQKIEKGDERINNQLLLEKGDKISWFPKKKWFSTYVDPGVTQHYTHLTYVSEEVKYISIYSRYRTIFTKSFRTAQKTFSISKIERDE